MNQKFLSMLLFAFLVAAGASFLLYRLVSSRVAARPAPATTRIIVAARSLELGTLVKETDLQLGDWNGNPPVGALRRKEEIVGRGVISPTYAGEPFMENRLAPQGAGAGLAGLIRPGMRAVAVRVNEIVGLAGFVAPGMRVDVLMSGTPPGGAGPALGSVTRTILQNIEVLSAGTRIQKDAEGKPIPAQVVNLLVTPEQAETLSLASAHTNIQLVLRNPLDQRIASPPGIALARLYGQVVPAPPAGAVTRSGPPRRAVPAAAPAPAPPPVVVEMIHGSKRAETRLPEAR